jgi:two-component system, cell cycle sensor histidine kinase and response regulator CckA
MSSVIPRGSVAASAERHAGEVAGRMRAVARAAAAILGARDISALRDVLRASCEEVIPFDAFLLGVLDAEGTHLSYADGLDRGVYVPPTTVAIDGTPGERVFRERRSLLTLRSDDPDAGGAVLSGFPQRSESAIRSPILAGGSVLGLVSVQSYTPDLYSAEDVEVLEAVAALAATSLQNIRYLHELGAVQTRVENLLLSSPAVLYTVSAEGDGRVSFISPNVREQLGHDPEDFTGDPLFWADNVHPNDLYSIARRSARVERERRVEEYRFRHRDGSYRWIRDESRLIRDPTGQPREISGYWVDITERRRAEEELRTSEERLALALEGAEQGLWDWNIATGHVHFSPRWEQILGFLPGEIEPDISSWRERIHPADRGRVLAAMRAHLRGETAVYETEHRLRTRSGGWTWVLDRGKVLDRDAYGQPRRMTGTKIDISRRKLADEELQRRDAILEAMGRVAERLLRTGEWRLNMPEVLACLGRAAEASRVYLIECDEGSADEVRASQSCEWAAEGVESQVDNPDMYGFSLVEMGLAGWEEAFRRGEVVHCQVRTLAPESREHFERQAIRSLVVVPIFVDDRWWGLLGFDECHQERSWSVVEREVLRAAAQTLGAAVQRERAEAALRRSEARFQQMAERIPQVFWLITPRGGLLYASPAFERVWGRAPEGYLDGRISLEDDVLPDDLEDVRAAFAAMSEREVSGVEYRIRRHRDGEVRWMLSHGLPVYDGAGALRHVVGTTEDVTDRKALEAQLRQSQKLEAVGRLAGGIAHDFNNLLTVIAGNTALLQGEVDATFPFHPELEEIGRAAERAASLTRQLLAYSRKQVLQPRVLDLNAQVEQAMSMLRRVLPASIGIRASLDPALGRVRADPHQVDQVLLNLVINARDAIPAEGEIVIATRNRTVGPADRQQYGFLEPGQYVAVSVRDTGTGMPPEVLARVFEPFFTTKEQGKGTGLGLAMVYGLVKQSGGYVLARSEPGRGSEFEILLPRRECEVESRPAAARKTVLQGDGTILLVEDEEQVRSLARRVLQRNGYTVVEACDGEDALRLLAGGDLRIDLLVTDVMMPRMGGHALAQRLQAEHPALRVVFMSGYAGDELVATGVL